MATQAELAQDIANLTAQNDKARAEVVGKIADLEAALAAGGPVSAEVEAAFAALKASVQADDDLVADPVA
jgi:hypothetical protein